MPLDGQLARLYRAYFTREADVEGLRYWRDVRSNAVRLDVVSSLFERSEEFQLIYGDLADDQFVEQMYVNVLGRASDPDGFGYWTGLLDEGVGRGTVVLGFSESAEFISRTGTVAPQSARAGAMERAHLSVLLRAPTRSELGNLVSSGNSLAQVATSLTTSAEARALWGTNDPEEMLESILLEFGFSGDRAAQSVERFQDGTSIGQLISEASQQPQFVAQTGTGI